MNYNNDFAYDLKVGQEKEKELAYTLSLDTIEVKHDIRACETGNIFVEYWNHRSDKPSGISTTEATHWAYILCDEQTILMPTAKLKKICKYYGEKGKVVRGGDNNTSEGVLIPLNQFLTVDTTNITLLDEHN